MELCTKGLGGSVPQLKGRGVNLSCVRTCVVVAEERPRIALCDAFTKLFSGLSLSPRAVSTSFGCRVNVAICLQVRKCITNLFLNILEGVTTYSIVTISITGIASLSSIYFRSKCTFNNHN